MKNQSGWGEGRPRRDLNGRKESSREAWSQRILGIVKSKCKSTDVGTSLEHLQNRKELSVLQDGERRRDETQELGRG